MSVVGAAIILGLLIAGLVKMKAARPVVVLICVLFGLVLGATPVGDTVYAAVAAVGRAMSRTVAGL